MPKKDKRQVKKENHQAENVSNEKTKKDLEGFKNKKNLSNKKQLNKNAAPFKMTKEQYDQIVEDQKQFSQKQNLVQQNVQYNEDSNEDEQWDQQQDEFQLKNLQKLKLTQRIYENEEEQDNDDDDEEDYDEVEDEDEEEEEDTDKEDEETLIKIEEDYLHYDYYLWFEQYQEFEEDELIFEEETKEPPLKVLIIAEKNSIARSIAYSLCKDQLHQKANEENLAYLQFKHKFRQRDAIITVTATNGHLFDLVFVQNQNNFDPFELFELDVKKEYIETRKGQIKLIEEAAQDSDILLLWLDNDKEGENICFECIDICKPKMKNNVQYLCPLIIFTEKYIVLDFHRRKKNKSLKFIKKLKTIIL